MVKLILSGGGSKKPLADFHELILREMPAGKKLLYLPLAMKQDKYFQGLEWAKQAFSVLGFNEIEMWETVEGKRLQDLEGFGVVYMGRGNTFKLLHEFRQTGFDKTLKEYALQDKGVLYGGSAGAVVLGKDIMTAAQFDKNKVGLKDTRGLDLVQGNSLWCHYEREHDEKILEYVKQHGFPVIAMPNGTGLYVEDKSIQAKGGLPVWMFKETKKPFAPGASLAI